MQLFLSNLHHLTSVGFRPLLFTSWWITLDFGQLVVSSWQYFLWDGCSQLDWESRYLGFHPAQLLTSVTWGQSFTFWTSVSFFKEWKKGVYVCWRWVGLSELQDLFGLLLYNLLWLYNLSLNYPVLLTFPNFLIVIVFLYISICVYIHTHTRICIYIMFFVV